MPFSSAAPLRITLGAGAGFIGLFSIVPAIGIFVLAFTDIRGIPYLPVHWVGWDNFARFFGEARWPTNLDAIVRTLIFAFVTTIIGNVLALLIAVALNRKLRGGAFYRGLVFLPTVLGVTIIGLIWSLVFNPARGPAAGVLAWFGASSAFFGDPSLALSLVMLVAIWSGIGVTMVIYLAGLQNIPENFYEAADVDGATAWQKLRLVTLPLLAPSITTNVLLSIVWALGSYQLAYVLTGARNPATSLLSLVIFAEAFGVTGSPVAQSQGYAAAIAVIQFLIAGVISLAVLAYLRRREVQL